MNKSQRFLTSTINILMIILVAGISIGSIPAHAGSAAGSAIMQYEKGMITEAELDQRLKALQYNDSEIRQLKAVAGLLEHQQEYVPESQSIIQEEMESKPEIEKVSKVSDSSADNIMLVMAIAGASTVAAIIVAFAKRPV
ncbi:MAG TPA: hypothetical protein VLC72_04895 [Nitrosopumilaceae archaeon]|nr:hypothetical protein [Nitrosopumilaceae archaeon]